MREVLEYCESNDIVIENFLFTGRISIQYVKDSVFGIDAQTELSKLFATIHRLHKTEKIKFVSNVSANYKLNLTEELTLEFLAPSYSEVEEYEKSTIKNYHKGTINNPKANNISSVIRSWFPLLTVWVLPKAGIFLHRTSIEIPQFKYYRKVD
jgi:hypothetical protein